MLKNNKTIVGKRNNDFCEEFISLLAKGHIASNVIILIPYFQITILITNDYMWTGL